jgi:chromosomal replication initiator protein
MWQILWPECLGVLKNVIIPTKFNQLITPLQPEVGIDEFVLLAPNQYIVDALLQEIWPIIEQTIIKISPKAAGKIKLQVGTNQQGSVSVGKADSLCLDTDSKIAQPVNSNLNPNYTLENFVEGKSNQLARAAAWQVANHPGSGYNPLFLYGGVGLGKTHLMQAIGNHLLQQRKTARVVYLHSERFVADMVRALQNNTINDFKNLYRTLHLLLIDDIQFFAGKERSQEELFHTFNALLESGQQIVLTSDKFPKELSGIEERLKSRFGAGLTVAIEPPDLETRVAILMNKALQMQINLESEVAFFIAKRVRANVRELEGALKRVAANARFTGENISLSFAQESLRDLLAVQEKLSSIDNIIKTTAEYYKVKVSDILSKRRSRLVVRPRQMAMLLCKELTNHSLPEIGDAFGGRDHTTVIHACKQVQIMRKSNASIGEDFDNLFKVLSA